MYKKQLKAIFSDYRSYISFVIFIGFAIMYYAIREAKAPGTWEIFWNNGMLPRFTNSSKFEGHFDPGYWWYFKNLIESRLTYWLPALVLPLLFKSLLKKSNLWDVVVFSYIMPFVMLLILSLGTKHLWYDAPAYPFFAIIIGLGIFALIQYSIEKIKLKTVIKYSLIFVIVAGIFTYPYLTMLNKVYKTNEWDTRLYNGLYIRHLNKENKSYYNYSMFFQGYNAPVEFYVKALNTDGKHHVKIIGDQIQHLKLKDTIMSCAWESYPLLDSAFYLTTIDQYEHCRMYVIDSLKNSDR